MSDDRNFWLAVRASLIRRAKLLEQERGCVMEEIAAIEQHWGIGSNDRTRQVHVTDADTIATAAVMESRA